MFMLSVIFAQRRYAQRHYAQRRYAQRHYAQRRYAQRRYAQRRYAQRHYTKFHYSERRYANCRYAECRDTGEMACGPNDLASTKRLRFSGVNGANVVAHSKVNFSHSFGKKLQTLFKGQLQGILTKTNKTSSLGVNAIKKISSLPTHLQKARLYVPGKFFLIFAVMPEPT